MPAHRDLGPVIDLSSCCAPLATVVPDDDEAAQLAKAFRALGDPVRLRLLGLLMNRGSVCACDLAEPVERSQPTVSHHLKVLREAGLVSAHREGTNIWYEVRADQLDSLRRTLGGSPLVPQP